MLGLPVHEYIIKSGNETPAYENKESQQSRSDDTVRCIATVLHTVCAWPCIYYMAVFQKDWKQPNTRIWLAKIDIDRSLDFPI